MVITNYAKSRIAMLLGNSGADLTIYNSIPSYFVIGTGSATVSVNRTDLIAGSDRQAVTSVDLSVSRKVSWQGDWNSVEISGLSLTEFGMKTSGTGLTGSIWSVTNVPPIVFDGTNELRIQETWEVY